MLLCHSVQVSQVEVYPGSGVLCEVHSWQAANQAQSPTAMARTLLMGVFDMNTLMNSNLRGGRSRRPAFQPQRSALDPHKINAIFSRFRQFMEMFLSSVHLLSDGLPLSVSQMPSWLDFLLPRKESSARESTLNCLRSVSTLEEPIGTLDSSDGQLDSSSYLTKKHPDNHPMRTQQSGAAGPMRQDKTNFNICSISGQVWFSCHYVSCPVAMVTKRHKTIIN